jgi:hypothetical protein
MRKSLPLVIAAAAALIFGGGCVAHSTFAGLGYNTPNEHGLADDFGGSWSVLEFGAILEEYKPYLIRGSIGHTWGLDSYSEYYEQSLDIMTFKASALYLFPGTSDTEHSGLYAGGGLSCHWAWYVDREIYGFIYNSGEGVDFGVNLIAGYRYRLGPKLPSVYAEFIFENVKSGSSGFNADTGGLQFLIGLNFHY